MMTTLSADTWTSGRVVTGVHDLNANIEYTTLNAFCAVTDGRFEACEGILWEP